jgi:hypothetical protein
MFSSLWFFYHSKRCIFLLVSGSVGCGHAYGIAAPHERRWDLLLPLRRLKKTDEIAT